MSNLKIEIKIALKNIFFLFPCLLGSILSLIYTLKVLDMYFEYRKHISFSEILNQNTLAPTFNAYTIWIGGPRLETDISKTIFFWFIILAATIPYTWSYCTETRIAKEKNDSFNNRISKYVAVFISSGLIAIIPLLINLISILLFVPAIKPDPVYNIYYREFSSSIMGNIFYSFPIVYEFIYICFWGIFCGFIGCVGFSFSLIIRYESVAVALPPILIFITYPLRNKLQFQHHSISPLVFMNVADELFRNYKCLFIEILIMFIFSFSVVLLMKSNYLKQKILISEVTD